jgi:DNA-binding response OmpR family regulator/DNA-binding CsgD family transcriptional regulator
MPNHDPPNADVVLIVDDVPENLSVLHDALDEAGYKVLVATSGEAALARARQTLPDIVLLDAMMPGIDGFEVARRLKADFSTQHIPIVFMTGLTETEHVVAAFDAGSSDYVTKPIRPPEVLARIAAHLRAARQTRQARSALDSIGFATLAVRPADGRIAWQTPQARQLTDAFFGDPAAGDRLPQRVRDWLADAARQDADSPEMPPLSIARAARRLLFSLHGRTPEGEWLVLLREESDAAMLEAITAAFRLTPREAEVLFWVIKGKTSRDIGDILGTSPRTVNKHLEHVFEKLGVETRTAAANVAMGKIGAARAGGD